MLTGTWNSLEERRARGAPAIVQDECTLPMTTHVSPPDAISTPRSPGADTALERPFDVAIVGGGVSGVALLRELAARGHRVLLVDKGDAASGTSQASGMLAWGGLLYLKNLELRTVAKLSAARDAWISGRSGEVQSAPFRYLPMRRGGRRPWWVRTALEAYWLLGAGRRRRPFRDRRSPESRWPFLAGDRFSRALCYEEACMTESDARLVLRWLTGSMDADRAFLDRTELVGAEREGDEWSLSLASDGVRREARARVLVNASGVWADRVADLAGLRTRHTHVLSKGVYLVLRRPPELDAFLAFEMGAKGDVLTLTPWGPVALFGSTETIVEDPDAGFAPGADDVAELASRAAENMARPLEFDDVVALRTGVRPLALERGTRRPEDPRSLSRKHAVDVDRSARGVTLFGGKFTSARALGIEAADAVESFVEGSASPFAAPDAPARPTRFCFPGHETPLVDPAVARDHERCRTLEDYLRRRTPLAQQVPRLGLGRNDEHADAVRDIARVIEGDAAADTALERLRRAANRQDDVVRRGLMEA